MKDEVRDEIQCALEKSIQALHDYSEVSLTKISDDCIACASIYGDKDSLDVSVILYAIGKLSQRNLVKPMPNWESFRKSMMRNLNKANDFLSKKEIGKYRNVVKQIYKEVERADEKVKLYIDEVLEKAKLKKACAVHEGGISTLQTSEALNVDLWNLQDYAGKTQAPDQKGFGTNILSRLKYARSLFK